MIKTAATGPSRRPTINRMARSIKTITSAGNYPGFRQSKVRTMVEELMQMTSPLVKPGADTQVLEGSVRKVCERAWEISATILSSGMTFDFHFPATGDRFSKNSMVPIMPDREAMDCQSGHWRVALCVTPVITAVDDRSGDNVAVHSVLLADVICMR